MIHSKISFNSAKKMAKKMVPKHDFLLKKKRNGENAFVTFCYYMCRIL